MNMILAALAFIISAMLATGTAAVLSTHDDKQDDMDKKLVSIQGTVTAFVYDNETCDDDQGEDDQDDDDEDEDEDDLDDAKDHDDDEDDDEREGDWDKPRLEAFVIENSTYVEFGPWWYWMYMKINITDVVHIGDEVNVTGEIYQDEDGKWILEAWHIDNLTTGKELTIKGEGRPPWAGGPKALGISPWPPSDKEE